MKQSLDKPDKHERPDKSERHERPHRKSHNHHNHHSHHNSHHHSHHNTTPVVVAPLRDPARLAREVVEQIPEGHHIIPYCWTVWHHSRQRQRAKDLEEAETEENTNTTTTTTTVDSYLQTTNEVSFLTYAGTTTKAIGSLEQMWLALSSVKRGFELPVRAELLVFKTGINPVWEDPVNVKGGRWVFRFSRRSGTAGPGSESDVDDDGVSRVRKRTTLIWERLVLKTLSGSLIPESAAPFQDLLLNDIAGLVLSVRRDDDIISVWNSNLNFHHKSKKLTSFQARRLICDLILRVVRECDMILQGSDSVSTVDEGSNERVHGVSFDYRLHADSGTTDKHYNGYRRHKRDHDREDR